MNTLAIKEYFLSHESSNTLEINDYILNILECFNIICLVWSAYAVINIVILINTTNYAVWHKTEEKTFFNYAKESVLAVR